MTPSPVDVAIGAGIVALASYLVVKVARAVGRWFTKALMRTFAETVSGAVAPDLARLGHRLGTSVDELRASNAVEHTEVQRRLGDVETRLHDVETRLVGVESHLTIRPSDERTRATDKEHPHA